MNAVLQDTALPLPVAVGQSRLLLPRGLGPSDARPARHVPGGLRSGAAVIGLGAPGPCPPGGTTTFFIFDQSASVTTAGGNDPLSRRHAEAALAIRHVAAACRCGRDLVSLVPFDEGSAGHVAPQPLTRQGVRRLTRGLEHLAGRWGLSSELDPPLTRVETMVPSERGAVAVVVFSDFLLTDTNPTGVIARLCSFPGYVHAVALGAIPRGVLVADPRVAVTRLTPSSTPGDTARAVFDGLNHYRHRSHDPDSIAHHTVNKKEHTP